ncbi:DUF5009 domain-containing protein [Mucilaginibacter sp. PPCGB 2223]|uniref:DUF5009 domain-containing protein n=1 Tax=Mucilaginibacter sp. PPCGB 2223 TaxID=1886027 RepID=UPI0009F66EB3|nr:DUF5009 domain-containing protein [Mucilaginibacter sp. PPCGB 2223]
MEAPRRLLSIDVFRSITMFFMIFVNDLSGVTNVPRWIDHADGHADAMGFADTIFPAFLFIVGLSLPFALENRKLKWETSSGTVKYILYRAFALIVMGFYQVNMETYSRTAAFPVAAWGIIATLCFFLIWLDYPGKVNKKLKYALIAIGYITLAVLAVIYKGSVKHPHMRPQWWGILGIIGWSYLVCALIYFYSKGSTKILWITLIVFAAANMVFHTVIDDEDIRLWILNDCSSVALVMAGAVTGALYRKYHAVFNKFLMVQLIIAIGLIAIGLLIRPYADGISKIRSTPPWVFICTGISLIIYSLLVYLVDIRGKQNWFKILRPAGTSTLTCYLLPYLIFFIMKLTDFDYPDLFDEGAGGIIRSFAMAFCVIILVGLMQRVRLRLKV